METITIARKSMTMLRGHKLTSDAMFIGAGFMLVEYDNHDEDDSGRVTMVVNGALRKLYTNPESVVLTSKQLLAALTAYLEYGWGPSTSATLAERLVSYYAGKHSGKIYANRVAGSTLPVGSFIVSGHPDGADVRAVLLGVVDDIVDDDDDNDR